MLTQVHWRKTVEHHAACETTRARYFSDHNKEATTCEYCREAAGLGGKDLNGRFVLLPPLKGEVWRRLMWWCMGCERPHIARVYENRELDKLQLWSGKQHGNDYLYPHEWNGDIKSPTLTPCWWEEAGGKDVCHLYVRRGWIQFVAGRHELARRDGLDDGVMYRPPVFEAARRAYETEHGKVEAVTGHAKAEEEEAF